jgi:hypothetical protein
MERSVQKFYGSNRRVITFVGKSTKKPLPTNGTEGKEVQLGKAQSASSTPWTLLREMPHGVFRELIIYTVAPLFFSLQPPSLAEVKELALKKFPHKINGGEVLAADTDFEIPERILLHSVGGDIIFTLSDIESAVINLVGHPTYTASPAYC